MADQQRLSAKPKHSLDDDRASFEPMAAATRGSAGQIRRNPSTDQKKVRRSQVRKTAGEGTKYALGGGWYFMASDTADAMHWTLYGPNGAVAGEGTAESFATCEAAARAAMTNKEASVTTAASDSYQIKRSGIGEWVEAGSTWQGALEAAHDLIDMAQSSTVILVRNGFNGSVTVVDMDVLGNVNSIQSYQQFFGRPYEGVKTAAHFDHTGFERTDGLGLEPGDPVNKLGDYEPYTFVAYDVVTDRVAIKDTAGTTFEVSPDVILPDDGLARQSRLTTSRTASIHAHILGHVRGRI